MLVLVCRVAGRACWHADLMPLRFAFCSAIALACCCFCPLRRQSHCCPAQCSASTAAKHNINHSRAALHVGGTPIYALMLPGAPEAGEVPNTLITKAAGAAAMQCTCTHTCPEYACARARAKVYSKLCATVVLSCATGCCAHSLSWRRARR